MIRRLIILLLIVGCDLLQKEDPPNEPDQPKFFSCIFSWRESTIIRSDSLHVIQTTTIHKAISQCLEYGRGVHSIPDDNWCECREGIKW